MKYRLILLVVCFSLVVAVGARSGEPKQPIRVGMIGLDTSHVLAFTRIINDPDAVPVLKRLKVVAGYPGGNPEFPLSRNRVKGYTGKLREAGVEIVDSIPQLLSKVDAVMLESVDGSQHLEQALPVFAAGKPLFIDKPLAASLADAMAIYELGRKHRTPWFSASSSRFTPGYLELRQNNEQLGKVMGCDAYSQSRAAPFHPDLFWYGVHGVDLLYTVMGRGCRSVTAVQTKYTESACGAWSDGRVGTFRSIREHTGKTGLGVTVFGTRSIVRHNRYYDYKPLVAQIARFFASGEPPVSPEETLEVFAFMEAAEQSKRQGGKPVKLDDVLKEAKQSATSLGLTPAELATG